MPKRMKKLFFISFFIARNVNNYFSDKEGEKKENVNLLFRDLQRIMVDNPSFLLLICINKFYNFSTL